MKQHYLRKTKEPTIYRALAGGSIHREETPPVVHVNAEEYERAMAVARIKYEALLPKCVTTFYLPPSLHVPETDVVDSGSVSGRATLLALTQIPFPCLRICQTVHAEGDKLGPLETEVICFGDGNDFGWMARDRRILNGTTSYTPTGLAPEIDNSIPMSYVRLIETLNENSARYEERPISRQTRRRGGFATDYHEYIVLRKPSKEQRKTALRLSAIFRRHPRLHAVRGHLRRYRTGLVVPVAPHVRGKGDMLQVKDYITEEAYYTES